MNHRVTSGASGLFLLVLILFLFCSFFSAFASANVKKTDTVRLRVTEVSSDRGKYTDRAAIGNKLYVKVDSLSVLLNLVNDDISHLTLRINWIVFPDLKPLRQVDENTLEYQLVQNDNNRALWDSLKVQAETNRMVVPVKISLAPDTKQDVRIRGAEYKLIFQTRATIVILIIFAMVLFVLTFFRLGKIDARLRNYGPDSSYSLALVQMAVWYYVVILAYFYLYNINGCPPALNSSITILLGISSLTALGARVADSSNLDKTETKIKAAASNSRLNSDIQVESLTKQVESLKSKGFIPDILSDEYGMALSRYQIVIWTLVMVYIFVNDVLTSGLIPKFSDGELVLMGISSGSYVGYKLKENPARKVS